MFFRTTCLAALCLALVAARARAQSEPDAYRFLGGEKVQLRYEPANVGDVSEQIVSDDGTVSLPSGNLVNIRGKTPSEAGDLLAERVKGETSSKQVRVRVLILDRPPRKVHVAGEVRLPKSIVLTPGVPLSLLGALQEAGGIGDKGDPARVNLVRTGPDGKRISETIDTTKLAQPGSADLGPKLEAGDVIIVPSALRGEHFTFIGEFARTGTLALNELNLEPGEKPLLSRVIVGLGGTKREADLSTLKILRLHDGNREVVAVDPTKKDAKDILLQNGDIVEVGSKVTAAEQKKELLTVSIGGKVRSPGLYPIGEHGLKLSKLILLAGGLADFAKGKKVTINRPSERRIIVVDVEAILKHGDWDQDIDMQDGDVVNVPERAF